PQPGRLCAVRAVRHFPARPGAAAAAARPAGRHARAGGTAAHGRTRVGRHPPRATADAPARARVAAGGDRAAAGAGGVLAVPAPGVAAVGRAREGDGTARPVRHDVARRLAGSAQRRHHSAARAVPWRDPGARADVLARPGAVALRRPHLDASGLAARPAPGAGGAGAGTLALPAGTGTDRPPPDGRAGTAAGGTAGHLAVARLRPVRTAPAGLAQPLGDGVRAAAPLRAG